MEEIEKVNLRQHPYLLLSHPRDKSFVNKILHDYNTKFSAPTPIRIYYDIETADTNTNDVPNHKS
jgi:hypothetical protein